MTTNTPQIKINIIRPKIVLNIIRPKIVLNIIRSKKTRIRWTLDRIIVEAREGFDYSLVKPEHINKGSKSKIPIICKNGHIFNKNINNHFHSKQGCYICSDRAPWTYERVMKDARKKFDYSLVKPEHINKGNRSKIPIICDKGHNTTTTINNHFNGKNGCYICTRKVP